MSFRRELQICGPTDWKPREVSVVLKQEGVRMKIEERFHADYDRLGRQA